MVVFEDSEIVVVVITRLVVANSNVMVSVRKHDCDKDGIPFRSGYHYTKKKSILEIQILI